MANAGGPSGGVRARPAARRRFVHLVPAWLSALANIALVALAGISLWTTIQISGLQEYFNSEIALRNRELVEASASLDRVRGEVGTAEERNRALEERRSLLEANVAHAQAALMTATEQNAALSRAFEQSVLVLDYREFLDLSTIATIGGESPFPYDRPINPGTDALERTVAFLNAHGGSNANLQKLARELPTVCAARMNTPLDFGPYESRATAEEWRAHTTPPENLRSRAEVDAWTRDRDAFVATYNAAFTRERDEQQARGARYHAALSDSQNALFSCAREILGISTTDVVR